MLNRIVVIAILAVLLACSRQTASAQNRSAVTQPASSNGSRHAANQPIARFSFEEDDGHIFFQARINGSQPLWLGLDTGAIRSIIDEGHAQRLGLKIAGHQTVGGAGGHEEAAIVNGVTIAWPQAELRNQTVWVLPLATLATANGREMAGIIGYELFYRFVVDIDYAARLIALYEPQSYEYAGPGESIPITLQQNEVYVSAAVLLHGRKPIDGQFVIDTGGNHSLTLAKSFVDEHRLLDSINKTIPARGGGVGGEITLAVGRVRAIRLGRFSIDEPIAALVKVGEIAAPGKAGNLGGRFLRRFRIIFDYSRRRMILEPNRLFAEPDEVDMCGAALASDGPPFTTIRILRVRPGSPAAEAGLLAQDVVLALDGQSGAALTLAGLRRNLRQDGQERVFSIKRGEQTLKIKVKLKRVI
jgi:aspartyl protease/PDZ domain-containing protein